MLSPTDCKAGWLYAPVNRRDCLLLGFCQHDYSIQFKLNYYFFKLLLQVLKKVGSFMEDNVDNMVLGTLDRFQLLVSTHSSLKHYIWFGASDRPVAFQVCSGAFQNGRQPICITEQNTRR